MQGGGDETLHRWSAIPEEHVSDLLKRRLVTGDRIMLAQVHLLPRCVVPMHSHDNEQFTQVLRGVLRFWLGADGDRQIDVHAGELLHLPSNLPHRAEALEDTLAIDVFSPPRQDWLDRTDRYLRGER